MPQYLDEGGEPIKADGISLPKGYSLLTSKKSPAAPNKKASVKELKILAAAKKPIVPPKGYIPEASVSAYTPSVFEQARSAVANSAIGYSLEQALPSIATALHLHPTEKMGTPQAAQHKDQLIAPEYLAPALTEAIRTGPLMGAPAPPEGHAPDATSNRIEGALTAAGGLTSGKSMATMGGIAAAAGLTAGVVNPASAQLLSRLVSGGFTADMLHGLYQQHKEYRKAVDAGDVNEAQKIQGEMGITGIMALLTGKHALTPHPFTPIESKDIPVRDRTNVLHRNTAGEVRQAKGQAPTVWLSPDAWKSFMGSLYPGEDATETNGINLKADRNLEGFANDPELSAADPHFGEVQKLLAEAHKNAGKGGVAIANTRPSLQANVNVMREELNHSWQRSLSANSHFNNHLSTEAFQDLNQGIPKGMKDYLVKQGYEGQEAPLLVTEAAAKLMDGRPERFGVSPDEAVDFLDKYFKHVSEQHGAKALEELHHVRGIAADAKARAIGEHSGTGGGQDNSAVPSVAAGGQGGTAEGVPAAGDALFNRDKDKPTWYLKSERLIGDKMKGPQAAEDVHKMLISGGVKPEEMQWTGLDDFLKSKGKDKVTPEEIREHLANNNIQIKEVTKGGQKPVEWKSYPDGTLYTPEGYQIERIPGNGMYRLKSGGGMTDVFNTIDEAKSQVDKYRENTRENTVPTNHANYQLPSGENYREMLLTMPTPMQAYDSYVDGLRAKYGQGGLANLPLTDYERAKLDQLMDRGEDEPFRVRSHWEEPNVLAHIRFNDRVGAGGEKLLHLEELQSDWGQKIRKEGVRQSPSELVKIPMEAKREDGFWEIKTDKGEFVANVQDWKHPEVKTAEDAVAEARRRILKEPDRIGFANKGQPDMPWKKNWHEQSLRRMLKHAAENGYEGLSWTPGEEQENRYWGNETVAPAVSRWNEVTKPESIGELGKNVLGAKMASVMPLDSVDGGMLSVLKHDQVRKAVVAALPVDVVDILTANSIDPDSLLSNPDVVFESLPVDSRSTVANGVLTAMRKTGAAIRTKLSGLETAGTNPEVLPTLSASDLSPREVAGLLDSQRLFHDRSSGTPEELASAASGTESLTSSERRVGNTKLGTTALADLLNAHAKIIHGDSQFLQQAFQPPPGSGMHGFYDKIVPDYLNKFGKKFGAKVGETEFKVPGDKRMTIRRGINGWDVESRIDENVGREHGLAFFSDEDYGGREGAQKAAQADAEERSAPKKKVQYLPITPEMRKSVAEEGVPLFNRERRVDDATRKRVEDMTPEEMRKALLTSDKTGIPNRRAFDDAEHASPSPAVGMSDADGLKALNDKFGYAAGDELLKAKAEALQAAGLDAYHEKGDEFLYRGASPDELKEKLEKARELLRNRTIEVKLKDGTTLHFKGADFSYGTGKDLDESEDGLKQHKSERETSGERKRGELRGIVATRSEDGGEHNSSSELEDEDIPSAEQDDQSLDVNTTVEGEADESPEQVEAASTGTGPTTVIPIQGGTQLVSAPKQEPVVKTHTSVPHQTTRTVSVPLQTAIPDAPVVTTRVLPLAQLKAMAAGLNPQRQPKSVREIMEEAKARMGNNIIP